MERADIRAVSWPTCQGSAGPEGSDLALNFWGRRTGRRLSGAHYEMLVRAITDYAIYMLDLDGIIISWNAGAERLKGYAETEIVGQHFSNFFTSEDRAAGKPATALKTAAETGRWEDEGWRVRKDGTQFWALAVLVRSGMRTASSLVSPKSPGT